MSDYCAMHGHYSTTAVGAGCPLCSSVPIHRIGAPATLMPDRPRSPAECESMWKQVYKAERDRFEAERDEARAERDRYRDALIECATIAGADVSDGVPDFPPVEVWAIQEVQQLRDDADEDVAAVLRQSEAS